MTRTVAWPSGLRIEPPIQPGDDSAAVMRSRIVASHSDSEPSLTTTRVITDSMSSAPLVENAIMQRGGQPVDFAAVPHERRDAGPEGCGGLSQAHFVEYGPNARAARRCRARTERVAACPSAFQLNASAPGGGACLRVRVR